MKSQIRFPIIINLRRGEQLQRNDQIPYIPLDTQRSLEQHPTIVSLPAEPINRRGNRQSAINRSTDIYSPLSLSL